MLQIIFETDNYLENMYRWGYGRTCVVGFGLAVFKVRLETGSQGYDLPKRSTKHLFWILSFKIDCRENKTSITTIITLINTAEECSFNKIFEIKVTQI